MKRLILAIILAGILAAGIAYISYRFGAGYVILSFADVSIESSFLFAVGVVTLSFFVFYYAIRAIAFIIRIPLYLRFRKKKRIAEQARQSLIKGLMALGEGRFSEAEKILIKHAPQSDTTLLNYLMAARAAQQQHAYDRRDQYLNQAKQSVPNAEVMVATNQAELQISHKQYAQALETLTNAGKLSPKNGYIKVLLANTYEFLKDWTNLSLLLDDLRKNRLLSEEAYNALEASTYLGLLKQLSKQQNTQDVFSIWSHLPRHLKENGNILTIYAEELIAQKQYAEAESLIRNYLNKHWHEPLVLVFGDINSAKPQAQLETAESWLQNHRQSAVLLLVAGKLCLKNKLWGKARTYLEASLSINPMAETYMHLAMLLEDKMQEPVKAQQLYQQGLKLAVKCGVTTEPEMPTSFNDTQPLRAV
ncbi:MAG: hypothetical protein HYZ31_13890 [Gammaproteobacteria bacterium]|jgi:HemY protein|nr:hypothetical protein [Gammaproteobacteria bacterium]